MISQQKIVIVGAGADGSTCAFTLMRSGLFGQIVVIYVKRGKAEGEVPRSVI